jgi:hypothetical protein
MELAPVAKGSARSRSMLQGVIDAVNSESTINKIAKAQKVGVDVVTMINYAITDFRLHFGAGDRISAIMDDAKACQVYMRSTGVVTGLAAEKEIAIIRALDCGGGHQQ